MSDLLELEKKNAAVISFFLYETTHFNTSSLASHARLSGCNANHKAARSLWPYHFSHPLIMVLKKKVINCLTLTAILASVYS